QHQWLQSRKAPYFDAKSWRINPGSLQIGPLNKFGGQQFGRIRQGVLGYPQPLEPPDRWAVERNLIIIAFIARYLLLPIEVVPFESGGIGRRHIVVPVWKGPAVCCRELQVNGSESCLLRLQLLAHLWPQRDLLSAGPRVRAVSKVSLVANRGGIAGERHKYDGEAGILQQLAKGEFEIVHVGCQWSVVHCQLLLISASVLQFRGSNRSEFRFRVSFVIRVSSFVILHSYLSASIGSTLAARRAGSQHARSATETRSSETTVKVSKSVWLTPNSRLERILVAARAPTNPKTTPMLIIAKPCFKTNASTLLRRAPTAILMPISRVRSETK